MVLSLSESWLCRESTGGESVESPFAETCLATAFFRRVVLRAVVMVLNFTWPCLILHWLCRSKKFCSKLFKGIIGCVDVSFFPGRNDHSPCGDSCRKPCLGPTMDGNDIVALVWCCTHEGRVDSER